MIYWYTEKRSMRMQEKKKKKLRKNGKGKKRKEDEIHTIERSNNINSDNYQNVFKNKNEQENKA